MLPVLGRLADLLGQLAPGAVQRRLALLVELAGGELEQVGVAGGLTRLADEPDVLVVVRDHRHRAGVRDPLARDLLAVVVAEAALADVEDRALEDRVRLEPLEPGAHGCAAASSRSARQTSSMPSSAATLTRSVGSWLCSVPFARLTTSTPCAISALASEPPPVVIRAGS